MHDSAIIWKDCAPSNVKNSIAIDSYTHETLLTEFERRYGQVSWFHDHSSNLEEQKIQLQGLLDTSDLAAKEYKESMEGILRDNIAPLVKLLSKRRKVSSSFNLLTSSFAKAGWAQ